MRRPGKRGPEKWQLRRRNSRRQFLKVTSKAKSRGGDIVTLSTPNRESKPNDGLLPEGGEASDDAADIEVKQKEVVQNWRDENVVGELSRAEIKGACWLRASCSTSQPRRLSFSPSKNSAEGTF